MSDGEVGAGRTTLDWAIRHNIPNSGWCPKGRIAEDGVISGRYCLKEAPSSEYAERAEKNILDSDGTVIFTVSHRLEGNSALTALLAKKHRKPCLHLHELTFQPGRRLARFVCEHQITALNVTGSPISREPGIGAFVTATMDEMLRLLTSERRTRQ